MQKYSVPRQIWRAVYPMLIIAVMHNFLSLITSVVTTAMYSSSNRGTPMDVEGYLAYLSPIVDKIGVLLGILGYVLCIVIFLPMWIKMRKQLPLHIHGSNPTKTAFIIAAAFLGLSFVQIAIVRVAGLTEHFGLPESSASLSIGRVILTFIVVVVVGPIAREICFRGIIQNRLLTWTGAGLSLFIQAIICGFAPFDTVKGIFDCVLGLALGYVYLRHRNIWLCIVAHMSLALPSFITRIMPNGITDTQTMALLVPGLLMAAIGGYFLIKQPAAVIAESAYDDAMTETSFDEPTVLGSVDASVPIHDAMDRRTVQKYSIPHQIWRALYPMLLTIAIPILVGSVIGATVAARHILSSSRDSFDAAAFSEELSLWAKQNEMLFILIANAICLVPFLPMLSRTRKQSPLYANKGNPITKMLCLAMAFTGISILFSFLISATGLSERFSYNEVANALSSGNVVIRAFTVLVFAPIVEEICFRGIIQNRLLTWAKAGVAIIAQAVIFGIAHMNIVQGIYTFILGIALGLVYLRFRNLWLCIAAHVAFNIPGFMIGLLRNSQFEVQVHVVIIFGIVLAVLGGYLTIKQPASVPAEDASFGASYNDISASS